MAGSQRLCRLLPTHAPWVQRNTQKDLKSTGEETFAFSPVFWRFYCLHDLRHEATHGLCCPVLLLPCDVGVGAEGEARVVVAEHTADGFDIHAVLECQGRERMPLRYNYDKPEKPRISRVFGYLARFFILFQTEKSSREVVIS